MTKMTLSEELSWRGFKYQTTLEDPKILDQKKLRFYWGVDPSAPSMTIGNLAAAMMARVFAKHGYEPYLLVGGATGLIGDPDGKAQERDLKTIEEIEKNKQGIKKQYKQIFSGLDFNVVDNYDWFKKLGYLEFLREVGKHVPLRQMVNRDFVQARIGEDGAGISYAEFSYSLIQGYDFLRLYEDEGVTLQLSGADQWGNSIAGVDLIRRKNCGEAQVWTAPLIVNKTTGKKFGKTEDGAIWLDPDMASPFKFYQFWLNVDDEGAEDYLKVFTTLDKVEIDELIDEFEADRSKRSAQKKLAYEVTSIVHGKDAAETQKKISEALFETKEFQGFTSADFVLLEHELQFAEMQTGDGYLDALVKTGLVKSKTEARRLIEQGAVNRNGMHSITSTELTINKEDCLSGYVVLIKGKKHIALVKVD